MILHEAFVLFSVSNRSRSELMDAAHVYSCVIGSYFFLSTDYAEGELFCVIYTVIFYYMARYLNIEKYTLCMAYMRIAMAQ